MTDDEKFLAVKQHLAESFCIDGEVNTVTDEFITSLGKCYVGWFELNDSKRGTFYIGIVSKANP